MKKIYVHLPYTDGCSLHRLILPYQEAEELTDELQFTCGYLYSTLPIEQQAQVIKDYDVFIFHRIIDDGLLEAIRQANPNVKIVMDMDDAWRLNDQHMLYQSYKINQVSEKIQWHIQHSDYVTCTTEYLANKIRPFNKNVVIFPNALKSEGQFISNPTTSNRLRFGLIGGATHMKDVQLLDGVVKQLPSDVLSKIQFVLCGFDKSYKQIYNADGTCTNVQSPWSENSWVKVERMLTDDYRAVSDEYRQFLQLYDKTIEDHSKESYKRIWLKDIFHYATAYNEIDVLLVPLLDNPFNACKSELKLIEASIMHKAAIVSDVMPYQICGINALEKGGAINPLGNCLMVNNSKGSRGWVKAITKLTNDTNLRNMITNNLSKLTESGKYCLTDVAKQRIEFLKQI